MRACAARRVHRRFNDEKMQFPAEAKISQPPYFHGYLRMDALSLSLSLDKRVVSCRVAAKRVLAADCSPAMIKQRPGNASCLLKKEKLPEQPRTGSSRTV